MKKQLIKVWLLTLLAAVLFAVPMTAQAKNSGTCGENLTWVLDNGVLVISGTGEMDDYTIHGTIGDNPCWPWWNRAKSIVIEEGVTSIGSYAFSKCTNLTSISLPNSMTRIGSGAFDECRNLNDVYIPTLEAWLNITFQSFTANPFYYASEFYFNNLFVGGELLFEAVVPEGVTRIPDFAFRNYRRLESIRIPDSVTSIGDRAFDGCNRLTSVSIPGSVTSIGEESFDGCSSLTSVSIADGVTAIGNYAFSGCSSLTSVSIPGSVTAIGRGAFMDCSSLTSINIPDSVTSINRVFSGCSSLTSISIPDSVTSINGAFNGCSSLTSINIPNGVTSIGNDTFRKCSRLTSISIPDTVSNIDDYAFEGCYRLTSINIPNGVTSIGNYAFDGCSSLTSINIPNGVTSIGNSAFCDCSSLTRISIPGSVTSIGAYMFRDCSSLTSIRIPDSVTSIGDYAFSGCSKLTSISIPDSITSIGDYTFQECDSLTSISIPDSVTSIGDWAFNNCTSLTAIAFLGDDLPEFGGGVFSGVRKLTVYCKEYSDADIWALERGYSTVYLDENDPADDLTISLPESLTFWVGETSAINADVFPAIETPLLVWSSSRPSVATVDQNGVMSALSTGTTVITVSCGDASAQMTVTVKQKLESFELSKAEVWLTIKETAKLNVHSIFPADADVSFKWSSSDTSICKVDEGLLTALRSGTTTVTVSSDNISRTCTVHVEYPVVSIKFSQEELALPAGDTQQLTAEVTTRDKTLVNKFVTFASDNEKVATVDSDGCVTAHSEGTATITATASNGISASCIVTVTAGHVPETLPAVAPTCTETGLTEGEQCTVCGEVLVAQEVIPALGHVEGAPVVSVEPTETTEGVQVIQCVNCNEILRTESIPATGTTRVPGDVNEDGKINSRDALAIVRYAVGQDVRINTANADVNADGRINSRDALAIIRYAVGQDVVLK